MRKTQAQKITYGVWLDNRRAFLIHQEDDALLIQELLSEIDESKLKGGSRSKTAYGPMDVSAEPQHNRRRDLQMNRYMEAIVNHMNLADSVLIFGPGQAKIALEKALGQNSKVDVNILVEPAQRLTENQMKALVREKFNLGKNTK